jgi:hypothetical protein
VAHRPARVSDDVFVVVLAPSPSSPSRGILRLLLFLLRSRRRR